MKKQICVLMILALVFSMIPGLSLADGFDDYPEQYARLENAVVLIVDTPTAAVNMEKVPIDKENPNVKPLIIDSRTLVPVRFIAESFGAEVGWDADTATVTVNLEGKEITLVMNTKVLTVDGAAQELDVAAQSIEGRTMIPLRAMVEAVGKQVFWDPKGVIVISTEENILDTEADAAFIDALIAVMKSDGEIVPPAVEPEPPESGPIFDHTAVEDVVDFDKVEEPYYIRDGLPNVNAKLQAGKGEVRVAYLGGSITHAAGYRTLTDYWLSYTFPKVRIESLDAGIDGTPSDFGALRFGTDVLSFNPDLVFVEFVVNDWGRDSKELIQSIEGIVRQAWNFNPNMDLIFVYTMQEGQIDIAAEGKYDRVSKIHDYVADQYGIPSVFMAYQVAKDAKEGKIIFNRQHAGDLTGLPVFSEDGTHPNSEGSDMYFAMLEQAYKELFAKGAPAKATAHQLIDPALYSKHWGDIKTYSPGDVTHSKGFSEISTSGTLEEAWKWRGPSVWSAQKVGESITVKFTGTQAGMIYLPGPDAPCIDVIIDGEVYESRSLFDVYHGVMGYTLLSYMTPELEYGEHTVEFKINETKADKAQMIKDSNYMVENGLQKMEENAAWFDSIQFIVGKILVNGELIE